MAERRRASEEVWDAGWEGARRFQLEQALLATPAQRLAWLEEAIAFAYRAGALPRDGDRPLGRTTKVR